MISHVFCSLYNRNPLPQHWVTSIVLLLASTNIIVSTHGISIPSFNTFAEQITPILLCSNSSNILFLFRTVVLPLITNIDASILNKSNT